MNYKSGYVSSNTGPIRLLVYVSYNQSTNTTQIRRLCSGATEVFIKMRLFATLELFLYGTCLIILSTRIETPYALQFISISQIVENLSSCELQIVHDGINSDYFEPLKHNKLPDQYYFPSRILLIIQRDVVTTSIEKPISRYVTKIREFPCKVSLLFSIFFNSGHNDIQTRFNPPNIASWNEAAAFQYDHSIYKTWPVLSANAYILVITSLDKSGMSRFFPHARLIYNRSDVMDNFAILFYLLNYFELCVMPQGLEDQSVYHMICKSVISLDTNFLIVYRELQLPPQIWQMNNNQFSWSSDKVKVDEVHPTNYLQNSNPFKLRNDKPLSRYHWTSIVVMKANATLFGDNKYRQVCGFYCALLHFRSFSEDSDWLYSRNFPFRFDGFQFVSCYKEPYITFSFYLMPYSTAVVRSANLHIDPSYSHETI